MSTTAIINTSGNYQIDKSFALNYSQLTRSAPLYSKTINFTVPNNEVNLFNVNEVTVAGTYMLIVIGDFTSSPWNLRGTYIIPLGHAQLAGGFNSVSPSVGVTSIHADNGWAYDYFRIGYIPPGTNYQTPGLKFYASANFQTGTFTAKLYKIA